MAKRYQRHNQKPYIKEGQSMQWSKYAKGISEAVYQRRTVNTMAKRYQRHNQKRILKDSQYNGQYISKA